MHCGDGAGWGRVGERFSISLFSVPEESDLPCWWPDIGHGLVSGSLINKEVLFIQCKACLTPCPHPLSQPCKSARTETSKKPNSGLGRIHTASEGEFTKPGLSVSSSWI